MLTQAKAPKAPNTQSDFCRTKGFATLAKDPAVSRDVESEQKKKTFTAADHHPRYDRCHAALALNTPAQLCRRHLTACVKKADLPDQMQIGGRKKRHPSLRAVG